MDSLFFVLSFFAFVWGSIWGSFATVLLYRIPRKISIFSPSRSFCPSCGNSIPARYNIPIFGFLILKGKCFFCKSSIPIYYFLIELLSGILGFISLEFSHFSLLRFLLIFFFFWSLLVASFFDFIFMAVPDILILLSTAVSILYMLVYGSVRDSIGGVLVGAGIFFILKLLYKIIRKKEGLGEGDVFFMIPVGIFSGFFGTIIIMIFSSFLGSVFFIVRRIFSKDIGISHPIPFIPFIFISCFSVFLIESRYSYIFEEFFLFRL